MGNLYNKKYTYKVDNGKSHLEENLTAWIQWVLWEFDNKPKDYRSDDKCKLITKALVDDIYRTDSNKNGKEHFWNDDEFNAWLNDGKCFNKSEKRQCVYCKCESNTLAEFYKIVNSARYTRGMNFEIDRKHAFMSTYLEDNEKLKNKFVERVDELLKNLQKTSLSCNPDYEDLLKEIAKDKEEYFLSLPAPYNYDNCVFACYWCNNAKTDAFIDKEFIDVGKAIGVQIEAIVKERPPKMNNPDTKINLCDSCTYRADYPYCTNYPNGGDIIVFGDGEGDDNICQCTKFKCGK